MAELKNLIVNGSVRINGSLYADNINPDKEYQMFEYGDFEHTSAGYIIDLSKINSKAALLDMDDHGIDKFIFKSSTPIQSNNIGLQILFIINMDTELLITDYHISYDGGVLIDFNNPIESIKYSSGAYGIAVTWSSLPLQISNNCNSIIHNIISVFDGSNM